MLKHEENSETLARPAAQVRVTPEELAQALSRIEARKDSGQRIVDGTISIGEAVLHLGVDNTPEEVLAEVQAARAQRTTAKNRRVSYRQRLALISFMGLGLIGVIGWWSTPHRTEADQAATAMTVNLSPPQAAPKPIFLDPDLLVGDASGKLVMLSEVGNNQPVRCRYDNGSFQQYSPENNQQLWGLIKHDGKVYVRGRMLKMSPKVFQSDGADVTTVDNAPEFATPITLPVSGFDVTPGAGSNIEFHAVNIHLDQHANEKWQP